MQNSAVVVVVVVMVTVAVVVAVTTATPRASWTRSPARQQPTWEEIRSFRGKQVHAQLWPLAVPSLFPPRKFPSSVVTAAVHVMLEGVRAAPGIDRVTLT